MNSMLPDLNLRAMINIDHGEPITTSYAVAEVFGKTHAHVMRDIKKIIKQCGKEFAKSNFGLTLENKQIGNTKRNVSFYTLTKDGFMLLVMGYTGEKAMQIKIAFIEAFNFMATLLTKNFQSDWARYNNLTLKHGSRKEQVSQSARDMRSWKDEKPLIENELQKLEMKLQPMLEIDGGYRS